MGAGAGGWGAGGERHAREGHGSMDEASKWQDLIVTLLCKWGGGGCGGEKYD